MSDLKTIINKLRHVVRSENEQLRRGIYTALQDTVSVKQTLLTEMDAFAQRLQQPNHKRLLARELNDLQRLLKENDRLMRTAINSVKNAYKQIASIRNTEKKVGAYNRFGNTIYIQDLPGLKTKLV